MIEQILPPGVAAEAFDDPASAFLFPVEEAALGRSVEKRRQEFSTARLCARRALAQLGLPAVPIPPGENGAPQWPAGVVGSITHCAGYRAAVLGHAHDLLTIGVDAEPNGPLPAGVFDAISSAEERAWLRRLRRAAPMVCWVRLRLLLATCVRYRGVCDQEGHGRDVMEGWRVMFLAWFANPRQSGSGRVNAPGRARLTGPSNDRRVGSPIGPQP